MAQTDTLGELPGVASVDDLRGALIDGKYRLIDLVGRGGMGTVYRARQEPLGRIVALKVVRGAAAQADDFVREASTAAKMLGRGAPVVFDYGKCVVDNEVLLYLAMEFLEGENLAAVLAREGAFTEERVVAIGLAVCDALEVAHALNIVHADLKPSNVMLLPDGSIRVVDFGIARVLPQAMGLLGTGRGSPRYVSPEVVRRQSPDFRSDIYGVGLVLYELLAGVPPFEASEPADMLVAHATERVPPIVERSGRRVTPALEGILLNALAKDPEHRFPSARALGHALSELHGLRKVAATTPAPVDPSPSGTLSELPSNADRLAILPPPSAPAPARSVWFAAIAGVVATLAFVVVVLLVLLATGNRRPDPVTVEGTPGRADEAPALPAAAVVVRIESDPSGAEVLDTNGVLVGRTPVSLSVPPDRIIDWRVRGADGVEENVRYKPGDVTLFVVTLGPPEAAPAAVPPAPTPASPKPAPAAKPKPAPKVAPKPKPGQIVLER